MKQENSYFQLNIREDKVFLVVHPPSEDGKRLDFQEVSEYLTKKGYNNLDVIAIGRALAADEVSRVLIAQGKKYPENEDVKFIISEDKMQVVARFYPPSPEAASMKKEDVHKALDAKGIRFGIDDDVIEKYIKNPVYCTDIIIANGLAPVDGHSAKITYHFNLEKSLKPKENEDGTVDFHSLDNINRVKKGDCLATMIPVDYGKPGRDVCGNTLSPKKVNNLRFQYGKNIYESEDKLKIFSDVEGHVELHDGRVFVSDTYEILDNVSTSTGDINYNGNVHIKGNVLSGFTVRARGNVTVDGVVECAVIDAGGSIILKSGIQGGKRGILRAKKDIVSKFLENAIVRAGGKITTEAILYSDVSAGDVVEVMGRKGFIVGGTTRSKNSIICKSVGSTMETKTEIEVGIDPHIIEEAAHLEKSVADTQMEKEKCSQLIAVLNNRLANKKLNEDGLAQLKKLTQTYMECTKRLDEETAKLNVLNEEIKTLGNGTLEVLNIAYIGVKLTIGNHIYYVRDDIKHKRFRLVNSEIVTEQVY